MTALFETMRAHGQQIFDGVPHARALGFELVAIEYAKAIAKVAWREDLVGDPDTGVIAGGGITALLDNLCGVAVAAAMETFSSTATLDLRIDYMRAAEPGQTIWAEAHCFKQTRSVAFVRAVAYDRVIDDPIATATAAFMLNSNAGRKAGANLK